MPQARRGELWVIDLGMAQKPRPCLILSIVYLDHERAVVSYVPRTTALRSTRFEVPHQARGLEAGAFDAQGIGSVPVVKLERRVGSVEPAIIQQVEVAVKLWLNLP
ncbi:MAG: type II toxin-antitoxin system PemK/MazF family toxin [Verrucomicrobia bacterium]|nr:MAG: type II toxin-antitoxin system PemK/MazF family toxin [Verrucomicrobiota bacterium]